MKKLFKAGVVIFSMVGVLFSAGAAWLLATNADLAGEFWSVRDDLSQIPGDRREEVVAELPARIRFENEVRSDLEALPEERRTELYEQLAKSREALFDQFRQRIAREAEIARQQKDAEDAVKAIRDQLGAVSVEVEVKDRSTSSGKSPLAGVRSAEEGVDDAAAVYGRASESSDKVKTAVGVLKALDALADEVVTARRSSLSSSDKAALDKIVTSAKATLATIRQTPGLSSDAAAQKLLKSVPEKLNDD